MITEIDNFLSGQLYIDFSITATFPLAVCILSRFFVPVVIEECFRQSWNIINKKKKLEKIVWNLTIDIETWYKFRKKWPSFLTVWIGLKRIMHHGIENMDWDWTGQLLLANNTTPQREKDQQSDWESFEIWHWFHAKNELKRLRRVDLMRTSSPYAEKKMVTF